MFPGALFDIVELPGLVRWFAIISGGVLRDPGFQTDHSMQ
jgi:hypothetical protein